VQKCAWPDILQTILIDAIVTNQLDTLPTTRSRRKYTFFSTNTPTARVIDGYLKQLLGRICARDRIWGYRNGNRYVTTPTMHRI
jgi:hypothetical protein